MLDEVLQHLAPQDNQIFLDCTFGAGGYTSAILDEKKCTVYALDRDPSVTPTAEKFKEKYGDRFHFLAGNFGDMEKLVEKSNLGEKFDGIVFDLGVSSMQLDERERGFSFSKEAPLDMRMGQSGLSAYDVVNTYPEEEIADIIYKYGDERKSRSIAKRIVELRAEKPIETTIELAEIAQRFYKKYNNRIDPATKTFQAIRIFVNDELNELKSGLESAKKLLKPGGRLVVVTFHSLEDKIVKTFFREQSGYFDRAVSKYAPAPKEKEQAFTLEVKKVVAPSDEEIKANPRARSAKLRVIIKN